MYDIKNQKDIQTVIAKLEERRHKFELDGVEITCDDAEYAIDYMHKGLTENEALDHTLKSICECLIMNKKEYQAKNLRMYSHYYNADMECSIMVTNTPPKEAYIIPLNKHILEPMGFEPVYDKYTDELYFQRDYDGYRIRLYPLGARLTITDLQYLHTVVDTKAEGLNELENYVNAIGMASLTPLIEEKDVAVAIKDFGKEYWGYYSDYEKQLNKFNNITLPTTD